MFTKIKNWLNTNNHLLWTAIIALIVIGLTGMYFIGPYQAVRYNFEQNIFFNKFWPFALVGTIILYAFSKLSKKWIIRISWVFGIIGLLLMLKTIIAPMVVLGSARYVKIGSAYIDPFMLSLPAYIVLMSHWLSKDKTNRIWTTIGTVLLTLFIVCAALMAPYIFMVQLYLLLFIIMTFKARKNAPVAFYTGIGISVVFVALMILAVWQMPHVQHRIMNIDNYATQMSIRAITGSALLGNTTESLASLSRLPGAISDFAFTSIVAKFGILIGLLILALYGCIAKGLTDTIKNTKDRFNKMLSTGVMGVFAVCTIVALMVAFGMLSTAAYWPFISFGGTFFLTWCILFGFVLAVNKPTKGKK